MIDGLAVPFCLSISLRLRDGTDVTEQMKEKGGISLCFALTGTGPKARQHAPARERSDMIKELDSAQEGNIECARSLVQNAHFSSDRRRLCVARCCVPVRAHRLVVSTAAATRARRAVRILTGVCSTVAAIGVLCSQRVLSSEHTPASTTAAGIESTCKPAPASARPGS